MRIFISGGTGFIGRHLCHALLQRGHRIRLLVHSRRNGSAEGIETVTGDATDPESLYPHLSGCDAAINLIGIIREFPRKGVTYERLHVEATRSMVTAAQGAGVRRYLQMSALGTRPEAVSGYHRTKYRAEELVRASGLDFTIFRPSIVFGKGDSFVTMLAGYIRNFPAVPVIGDGNYRLQPISADDVARSFAESLQMPETSGATFEICGPERFSYNEMLDMIGRVIGKGHVRKVHSPLLLMKLLVPFLETFPAFPLTMDQLQMLVEENICDGGWRRTFPFTPVGFEAGIREYLRP